MLKTMRDVAEHFDDYAIDKGRDSRISRSNLEVGSISDTKFKWLGHELDTDVAFEASKRLFAAINQAISKIVSCSDSGGMRSN